jgi:hypothetical protein
MQLVSAASDRLVEHHSMVTFISNLRDLYQTCYIWPSQNSKGDGLSINLCSVHVWVSLPSRGLHVNICPFDVCLLGMISAHQDEDIALPCGHFIFLRGGVDIAVSLVKSSVIDVDFFSWNKKWFRKYKFIFINISIFNDWILLKKTMQPWVGKTIQD